MFFGRTPFSKEQIKNLTVKVDYFSLNIKFIEDGTAVEEKATWSGALVDKEWSSLLNLNFRKKTFKMCSILNSSLNCRRLFDKK